MAGRAKQRSHYEGVADAIHPGKEFLPEGERAAGKVEVKHAAIFDPSETRAVHLSTGRRQRVAINVARDPLEREHAYGRIDRHQYEAGKMYRRFFDNARGRGDPGGETIAGGRPIDANERAMVALLEAARALRVMKESAERVCGQRRAWILERVLGDEMSFKETATAIGNEPGAPSYWKTKRGLASVAAEFREALEQLAEEWFKAERK